MYSRISAFYWWGQQAKFSHLRPFGKLEGVGWQHCKIHHNFVLSGAGARSWSLIGDRKDARTIDYYLGYKLVVRRINKQPYSHGAARYC
jgi:hypothetical protein